MQHGRNLFAVLSTGLFLFVLAGLQLSSVTAGQDAAGVKATSAAKSASAVPKQTVLILCTGNSCRSIMGEALLRARAGDRFNIVSAGMAPKGVNSTTIKVLKEIGISTEGLHSKDAKEYVGKLPADFTIVVCPDAQEKLSRDASNVGQWLFWPFDDPPAFQGTEEQRLEKFREVRDQIDAKIQSWLRELDAPSR